MLPAQPNHSLIEGVRCLQALSSSGQSLRSIEVSRLLKIEPTRTHRLLKTLAHLGLAHQNDDRKFQAGPGIHALASQSLCNAPLWRAMREPLQDLQRQTPSHKITLGMCWEGIVSGFYGSEPGMPADWAMGRMDMQAATRSAIGLVLLSGSSQERVEEIFIGRPIPDFPGGLPALAQELRAIRSQGYGLVPGTGAEPANQSSLAVPQENKLYAIALTGTIAEEDIRLHVQLMRHTLELLHTAHE